jgi:beta-glucosidase
MNIQAVLNQLSTEDKIKLCSGKDMWHLESFPKLGIDEIMVADGPHGLRKASQQDKVGVAEGSPSTCFPTASLTACSWDKELIYQMGQVLAEEALAQNIAVILGPGVNIKRNPRCGRNFEYFSEDPYLSGWMAASFIKGVQSQGIGTSLKHFAANNQELDRLTSSSNIDPRALREIYLKPFEIAVKHAQPWTIMASYNKINGVHSGSNPWLLKKVLRDEWGFNGLVVSDWGATHEREIDLKAGLDLEMPGNDHYYDTQVLQALKTGKLKLEDLDLSTLRVLDLINKSMPSLRRKITFDPNEHHAFARKIAQESIVLLKNDQDLLPLDASSSILVLGELAEKPRIQGAGSSKVTPYHVESLLDGLREVSSNFSYRRATNNHNKNDFSMMTQAVSDITEDQIVVIVAGLTEETEMEGLDRSTLKLPLSQESLIETVLTKTSKVIIILAGGSPFEMPWVNKIPAILNGYLPGEAGGLALADILYGKINPSGKLAETYPLLQQDNPCDFSYGIEAKNVYYRESIFVGYRYYDSAKKEVLFPFGHGLHYTQFEYRDLSYAENVVSFTLTNIGQRSGSEIVQINLTGANYFPSHELKAFEKITLKAGESKVIHLALDESAFQYYDSSLERFICANGIYEIQVGASSRDLRLSQKISLVSQDPQHIDESWKKLWFGSLSGLPNDSDFEALTSIPVVKDKHIKKGEFTIDSTFNDMNHLMFGKAMRLVMKGMLMKANKVKLSETNSTEFKVLLELVFGMTLRGMISMSEGKFSRQQAYGILELANGHWSIGIKQLTKKDKTE